MHGEEYAFTVSRGGGGRDGHWSCTGWELRCTGVENGVTRVWRVTKGVVCVYVFGWC